LNTKDAKVTKVELLARRVARRVVGAVMLIVPLAWALGGIVGSAGWRAVGLLMAVLFFGCVWTLTACWLLTDRR